MNFRSLLFSTLCLLVIAACAGAPQSVLETSVPAGTNSIVATGPTSSTTTQPPPTTTTTLVPDDGLTSAERQLVATDIIDGDIAPKSIVSSGNGLFLPRT